MRNIFLAAGVAALAIAVPASAKPDKGGGNGGGGQKAAKVERGGGGGGGPKAQRASGGGQKSHAGHGMRFAQQQQPKFERAPKQQRAQKAETRAWKGADRVKQANKVERQRFDRQVRVADDRGKFRQNAVREQSKMAEKALKRENKQFERVVRGDRDIDRGIQRQANIDVFRDRDWQDRVLAGNAYGFVDSCPPGLAKKAVACMPPGQAKKMVGQSFNDLARIATFSQMPIGLRDIYADNDDYYYRYANGYAYKVDRESQLVNALLPLFGLGVPIGQQFPTQYMGSNYMLPTGLQPFYANYPGVDYRYANGYVYEIDPYTGLVEDVDPMLGYGYGYGQMLPASYSAYNVPYDYRSMYQDTDDYYYRYAPGSIYRVDAGTGLIDSVAALLTGGMTVGQQMPMGYNVYNVPYDYRDDYYDTQDDWYRYSNGNIYRVDPTTQLVTALVRSILT